jgi:hypothetical protein
MADLVTPLLAGLVGGTFSGSLSGVLVFEYQTKRQRQLAFLDSRETVVALLEQVLLLAQGAQQSLATARRVALQDLLAELARALPSLAAGLDLKPRHALQTVLLRLGDAVANPGTNTASISTLAEDGLAILRA